MQDVNHRKLCHSLYSSTELQEKSKMVSWVWFGFVAVWNYQTSPSHLCQVRLYSSETLDQSIFRTSISSSAKQVLQSCKAARKISWHGVWNSLPHAQQVRANASSFFPQSTKGNGMIPRNRTISVRNNLSVILQGLLRARLHMWAAACPSRWQNGSWGINYSTNLPFTNPIQRNGLMPFSTLAIQNTERPVHFKSLTKTQAWVWQEFLSHWVFLCVVYNNMQTWCQVLIY